MGVSKLLKIHDLKNVSLLDESEKLIFLPSEALGQPVHSEDIGIMIFMIFLYILLETVGNFLLFCIIMYEKFGMDPQKRTITNRLLSSICAMEIVFNVVVVTLKLINRNICKISKHY